MRQHTGVTPSPKHQSSPRPKDVVNGTATILATMVESHTSCDSPREKPEKRNVDTGTSVGLISRIDLSPTKTGEGIEHAWIYETDESQHGDLGGGVVVVTPPT
jgi:hypothetical protein